MSAITMARDVVPFGVDTIVVCSQSGALSGIRFWKKLEPVTPFGNRCSSVGRSRTVRMIGCLDGEVVVGDVELGDAWLGEHRLLRAADLHGVAGGDQLDRRAVLVRLLGHGQHRTWIARRLGLTPFTATRRDCCSGRCPLCGHGRSSHLAVRTGATMTTTTQHRPGDASRGRRDLVASAEQLQPLLRESMPPPRDDAGELSDEVVDALHEHGLFGMWVPEPLGGAELDPLSSLRVIQTLAEADPSTAWVVMAAALATGTGGAYLSDEAVAEMFGGERFPVVAGQGTRPGQR